MKEDTAAAIIFCLVATLIAGALIAFGVWQWREANDKRECRRSGGTVELLRDGTDWHCVGARGG